MNFKNECIKVAKKSLQQQHHGCVIVKNGRIISRGCNIDYDNDFLKKFNPYKHIHAEACAVMRANYPLKHLKDSTMYVCRVGLDGNLMNSRPCPMCQKIIKAFNIKKVKYSKQDGTWEEVDPKDLNDVFVED
ncbi:MAG: deaminase [Paludibacteraceae bacterium]|nr:deaminase [Paludibacteraceae bacterium]